MYKILKSRKTFSWCLFDFGISSYPTLILTFFYGAFYAKQIASNPNIGTSNWGFAISAASILSFLVFSFVLIHSGRYFKSLSTNFFKSFFYLMVVSSSSLIFFNENSNQFLPLLVVVISFIAFEVVNLFYNVSLHKVAIKKNEGMTSNLGWAFGYLGGLISLMIIFILIRLFEQTNYEFLGISFFLLIGPFVGFWTLIFGNFHLRNFRSAKFEIPNIIEFIGNVKSKGLGKFLISYFFFNNAVICIFAFASMFASFLFDLSESQIIFLGIFINLFGIMGCLILGRYEDKLGSEKIVKLCILALLILTFALFCLEKILFFWAIALLIGFFIGPIQASSRSVLVKKIKSSNQVAAFCTFSIFGNICAVLGPFMVGLVIDMTNSIRQGLLVIPVFFFISIIPYLIRRTNV